MSAACSLSDHRSGRRRACPRPRSRRPSPRRSPSRRRGRARRPRSGRESPSRWNGRNSRSRSVARDAGPRSTTRTSTPPSTAPAIDARRAARRRERGRRSRSTFASARSSRPGSASTRRQRLGRRRARPRRRAAPRLCERRGHDLVEADRARRDSSAPVCRRLMSSRLPTRALRRSVSSSIVSRNSCARLGRPVDVVLEQARDRRLDRRERRAEVVRDGREERGAQLVRRREGAGRRGLGLELAELDATRRARARTRRGRAGRSLAAAPAGEHEHVRRRRARPSTSPSSGVAGTRSPRAASTRQPSPSRCRTAAAVEREHAARAPSSERRSTGDEPASRAERLGLGSRARALGRAARRRARRSRSRSPATTRKTTSARMFSPSAIVNVWSGGVKYQLTSRKPPTAAASAGPEPADRRDARRRASRKSSRTLGSSRSSRSCASSDGEQRQADDGERRTPSSCAAARQRARAGALRGTTQCVLGVASAWLITCTSMPTPESRITLLITEPRISSLPARAAARAQHDLRRVQRARRLDERLADVARRRPRGTCRRAPRAARAARSSSSAERRGEAVLRDARARRRARPSRAAPCAPARRTSALAVGRAGERDERPARASPTAASMPCRSRYSASASSTRSATHSERELAQRARGCPGGSSWRARRRSARPGRCCRAPCRRRSASGVMSTSSIWSARRTTASGIVSRCLMPVICSTTSLSDSRCWMLSVEMTSIPASSSSSTSCQRFSLREPGTFVCASSSTSATSGRRARTASTSISSNVVPR